MFKHIRNCIKNRYSMPWHRLVLYKDGRVCCIADTHPVGVLDCINDWKNLEWDKIEIYSELTMPHLKNYKKSKR